LGASWFSTTIGDWLAYAHLIDWPRHLKVMIPFMGLPDQKQLDIVKQVTERFLASRAANVSGSNLHVVAGATGQSGG